MKRAIVLGASSGIGKELAGLLAENNYLVGITGRRSELLEKLKSCLPDKYFTKVIDITDLENVISKLEELVITLGGLDLLIISSSTGDINKLLDFEIEKRTIDTNVLGFTLVADWAYRFFEKQQTGHLVGISSIAGLRGSKEAPAYNATKAYQINYLEGLRQKASSGKFPIYVTDIRPGLVDTEMAKGDGLFWVAPVEKAAKQIYQAIKDRKKVKYITRRWYLLGCIVKMLPRAIYDRM